MSHLTFGAFDAIGNRLHYRFIPAYGKTTFYIQFQVSITFLFLLLAVTNQMRTIGLIVRKSDALEYIMVAGALVASWRRSDDIRTV